MAIFKCKMCGGTLEVNNETVAVCQYCGTKQTLPKLDDDRKANLYDRANHFRRNNEFDKAMGIYEQILNEDNSDAESYWSLVLCRYGIEYVEDPTTHKRIPTVNRAQFTSIFDDEDYKSALQYADGYQKEVYEQEATVINDIQKGILAISSQEEPFDVFICYKESDNNGRRTPDSVLATELYHELVREGFKVFFARITLEDKLGQEYEPYIFAALNSAKVMVVLGTKPEFFNAVWVKNEWSRYLALIKNGARKMLIPAYKDMDPYDLPEEFSHLQAQDMSKLGFMQDLIRGIKKIVEAAPAKQTVVKEAVFSNESINGNVTALLKRGYMALEDGEWSKADDFFEQCLNQNAELAEAYLGKLMAELQVRIQDELKDCEQPFDDKSNYQKTVRFADNKIKTFLSDTINSINERNENTRLESIYNIACNLMEHKQEEAYKEAATHFKSISGYKDADTLADECSGKAEIARKDRIYKSACDIINDNHTWYGKKADTKTYEETLVQLQSLNGWKDSEEKIQLCKKKIEELKEQLEKERIAKEQEELEKKQLKELERIKAEKRKKLIKKIAIITTPVACTVIAFIIILNSVIIPSNKYNDAVALIDEGKYKEAVVLLQEANGYKDSAEKLRLLNEILNPKFIDAGSDHTVALKADGTVVATEYAGSLDLYFGQCDVTGWKDVVAVSTGEYHTVGLKSDGTVVATGLNNEGQCDVGDWKDIIAVSAGNRHTVGLKSNGTVVATGDNNYGQRNVSNWKDIIAVSAGNRHTVGLKSNGTVVATEYTGDYDYYRGQCDVTGWKDVVAVSTGEYHTVGLKSDGTVVAAGYNDDGQCDIEGWKDIVAISAGDYHTVGLKSDGTVVATQCKDDFDQYGQCDVTGWKDIIAVSTGEYHTVGLKSDGTVIATEYTGSWDYGMCDVKDWKNIKVPQSFKK